MPEQDLKTLKAKLESSAVAAIPEGNEFVAVAISKLQAHLEGRPQTFEDVPLDLRAVAKFHKKVYQTLQNIPAGQVTTYGDLAGMSGSPLASRAVGQAMAKNPLPIIVPCHRVLGAAGKLGGFSAFGGQQTKLKLLNLEKPADRAILAGKKRNG